MNELFALLQTSGRNLGVPVSDQALSGCTWTGVDGQQVCWLGPDAATQGTPLYKRHSTAACDTPQLRFILSYTMETKQTLPSALQTGAPLLCSTRNTINTEQLSCCLLARNVLRTPQLAVAL